MIYGFDPSQVGSSRREIHTNPYTKAIVQARGSSFMYDEKLAAEAKIIVGSETNPLYKSEAIFHWIVRNISYDDSKEKKMDTESVPIRSALEVYYDRTGICSESSALQVTMERLVGNRASLARVGDKHACAVHFNPSGKTILIDTTTPQGFDYHFPRNQVVIILSDDECFAEEPRISL